MLCIPCLDCDALLLMLLFPCNSVALLGSVLAHVISCRHMGPPPASLQAWEGLATQACIQLLAVCMSQPNQKKVFTAVVTKQLLLQLCQAIWLPDHTVKSLGSKHTGLHARPWPSGNQLAAAAQQVLHAVIFHSSSMEGLIELGTHFSNSISSTELKGHPANHVAPPRSYHLHLLLVWTVLIM